MTLAVPLTVPPTNPAADRRHAISGEGAVRVRTLTATDIDDEFRARWDALARRASDPDAFAMRWFLEPSLRHHDADRRCRIYTVVRDDDLIGLFALAPQSLYGRLPLRHVAPWAHPNMFLAAVLVAHDAETPAWAALFDRLAQDQAGFVLIGPIDRDGGTARGLVEAADAASRGHRLVKTEARALFDSDLSADAYWQRAVRGKKRKELRRQERRLGELGALAFDWLEDGDDLADWCDEFLELEAAGWKGAAGSALAAAAATAELFRDVLSQARDAGALAACRLTLDGRAIAMLATLIAPGVYGDAGFSFKTAYDEALAAYSPGVLLQRHNLGLPRRAHLAWIDSCAAPDHPMIDSLWTERRRLGWYAVPLAQGWPGRVFDLAHRAKAWKKRLFGPDIGSEQIER